MSSPIVFEVFKEQLAVGDVSNICKSCLLTLSPVFENATRMQLLKKLKYTFIFWWISVWLGPFLSTKTYFSIRLHIGIWRTVLSCFYIVTPLEITISKFSCTVEFSFNSYSLTFFFLYSLCFFLITTYQNKTFEHMPMNFQITSCSHQIQKHVNEKWKFRLIYFYATKFRLKS